MSSPFEDLAARVNLRGFYRWWIGELQALLPSRLRVSAARQPTLLCMIDGDEVILRRLDEAGVADLGRRPLPAEQGQESDGTAQAVAPTLLQGRVLLRLSRRQALVHRVALPLATLGDLRQVLRFEMERQTPFSAEQVYFDYHVVHKNTVRQQVEVDLYVVPRGVVDRLLLRLAHLGIRPTVVDVGDADAGTASIINLLPAEHRRAKVAGGRLNRALAALLVLLLVAAVAVPLWEKRRVVVTLLPLAEQARQEAAKATALRAELESAVTDAQFLAEMKHRAPVVIDILDELTQILPDDTWLQVLELRGEEVRLQGESEQATALVALVEASPMFQGAAFQSPVTRNPATGAERFNLAATVAREDKP